MKPWSPAAAPRAFGPHRRLRCLLARQLPRGLSLGSSTLRAWASANFVGSSHQFRCTFATGEAEALRAALDAQLEGAEWRLPGHVVADTAVRTESEAGALQIEILTIED
ncbi:hypothetical protein [Sphingopyxis flava]|uniref:Uncharacterized protein n=1 Tax=Sphingopyxis flava TaxID=1507287 RepID=A0A1T4ZZZ9_9SPHN|nr:hypothetical protein [Sphingopyxis flava]SKB28256.1 hypothetical protein SAMN06295937_100234 [Sphingopyxis flava]